jgi:hypothetical protein
MKQSISLLAGLHRSPRVLQREHAHALGLVAELSLHALRFNSMTAITRKLAMRPSQTSLNSDYQTSSFLYSKKDPGAMLLCNQPRTLCARNRASNRLGDMCLGPAHCCLHSGGFSPLSPCTHTLPKGHTRLVGRTLYDLNFINPAFRDQRSGNRMSDPLQPACLCTQQPSSLYQGKILFLVAL